MTDCPDHEHDRVDLLARRLTELENKVDRLIDAVDGEPGNGLPAGDDRQPAAAHRRVADASGTRQRDGQSVHDTVPKAAAPRAAAGNRPGHPGKGSPVSRRQQSRRQRPAARPGPSRSLGVVGVLMLFGAGVTIAGIWLLVATAVNAGLVTDGAIVAAGLVLSAVLFGAGVLTGRSRLPQGISSVFVVAALLGYAATVLSGSAVYGLWPPIVSSVLLVAGNAGLLFWLTRRNRPTAIAWAAGLMMVVATVNTADAPSPGSWDVPAIILASPVALALVVVAVTRRKPWSAVRASTAVTCSIASAAHLVAVWLSPTEETYVLLGEAVVVLVVVIVALSGRCPSPGALSDSLLLVVLPATVLSVVIILFESWATRGLATVVTVLYLAVALAGARLGEITPGDTTTAADPAPGVQSDLADRRMHMIVAGLSLVALHLLAFYQALIDTSPLTDVDFEVLRLGMLVAGAAVMLALVRFESMSLPVVCWSLVMVAGPLPLIESTLEFKPLWLSGTMSILTGITCVLVTVVAVVVATRFGPLPKLNAVVVFFYALLLSYTGIVTVVAFILSPVSTTDWAVFVGQGTVSLVWLVAAGWLLLGPGSTQSAIRGTLGLALAVAASIKLVVVDLAGSNDWIRIAVFLLCGSSTLVIAVLRARRDRATLPDTHNTTPVSHATATAAGAPVPAAHTATPGTTDTGTVDNSNNRPGWTSPYTQGKPERQDLGDTSD
ncbi:hypothetical protein ACFSSC_06160 [Corynebacterium mendelii]|uniref:DUF2339 domain-containing protein n=1 Tax=Corynebacterium mendelii TaxID=2765362 RepID=A0A939E0R1_9CORY|nr:hypothetical protein [Corynebacterium mendelii]MBN9644563.1 hypothetical protein [Corynebacterium mendelii]